jgi:heme-degrading monooxygenase HmoA
MESTNSCTAGASHGGMTIASFVIAISGLCIAIAALVMSIINAVRISRIRTRLGRGEAPEAKHRMASHINADNISSPTIFHPLIKPPYYVCIFTSRLNLSEPNAIDGYAILADEMEELAKHSEGYLGIDSSTRNTDGMGITISYWSTENAIKRWKLQTDPRAAQLLGKDRFFSDYHVHIAKVEREYAL